MESHERAYSHCRRRCREAHRLASTLAHLGHACEIAGDGDEALRRLESEPFDCLLLDLVLPGLDGMGLLRVMRARGIAVPVVAAVTAAGIDAVESAIKAGARDFVVKPAGALRLRVSIANALSHARLSQALLSHATPWRTGAMDHDGESFTRPSDFPANVVRFPVPTPLVREQVECVPLIDATGHARPLALMERDVISAAVALYGGRMSEVARRLGIGRSTLYRRIGELGLPVAEPVARLSVAAE